MQKEENQDELKEESEKELVYLEGFKKSVEAKLANEVCAKCKTRFGGT